MKRIEKHVKSHPCWGRKINWSWKVKARESNYSPDSIELTWEEYDSIPCITEREAN